MPVSPSTTLLKAKLLAPPIPGCDRASISAGIKKQRCGVHPLLEQVAAIEALLFDAIEDETNEKVAGKYESARQTMVAIRRHVANVDDYQHKLSVVLRNWETESADILRIIGEEE